jgi:hypothetical protein
VVAYKVAARAGRKILSFGSLPSRKNSRTAFDPSSAWGLPRGAKPNIRTSFFYSNVRENDYMVHSGCITKTMKSRSTKITYSSNGEGNRTWPVRE